MSDAGWFAERDDEEAASADSPWRPTLQLDGMQGTFDIWFRSEQACLDWIRAVVLDKGMR